MKPKKPRIDRTFQTKRKPGRRWRLWPAKPRRKKPHGHQSSTTADDEIEGEIPGVTHARMLFVILMLHLAAIGGIYWHKKWTKEQELGGRPDPVAEKVKGPRLIEGVQHYRVQYGDNYNKIAAAHGVQVDELKRLNENMEVAPGIEINIPLRQVQVLPQAAAVIEPNPILPPIERPGIQLDNDSPVLPSTQPQLVEVEDAPAEEPIFLSVPQAVPEQAVPQARRQPAPQPPAPAAATRSYTVQKGDTVWGIARKNGVKANEIIRANNLGKKANIRVGQTLVIPGR